MKNKRSIIISSIILPVVIGVFMYFASVKKPNTIGTVLVENGYVELRPPSNLYRPGMWVTVLNENPLHLDTICGPQSALGLEEDSGTIMSESSDLSFKSQLSGLFVADLAAIAAGAINIQLAMIQSVTFKLSNIKLVEIPDDVVRKGLDSRTSSCSESIKFRLGKQQTVSMVKSVLVADVIYNVSFEDSTNSEDRSQTMKDLALHLGTKIDISQTGEMRLIGRQLVWGIRDDSVLAKLGYELPPTGGTEHDRSVLNGKGPITRTLNTQARRTFPELKTLAIHQVEPLKQTTVMGCWATVYTMMKSWKDDRVWTVGNAVADLGDDYVEYYVHDRGLPGGFEYRFVSDAGMIAKSPASYPLSFYAEILRDYGPIWITIGDGIRSHALLLVGIYGSSVDDTEKSYEDAIFEFIDPAAGVFIYEDTLDFLLEKYENEVLIIQDLELLRPQIFHWPSVEKH